MQLGWRCYVLIERSVLVTNIQIDQSHPQVGQTRRGIDRSMSASPQADSAGEGLITLRSYCMTEAPSRARKREEAWTRNSYHDTWTVTSSPTAKPQPSSTTFSAQPTFSTITTLIAMSTFTPLSLYNLPSKSALVDEFVGKSLSELRTPALIVDRTRFKANCERVAQETERRGLKFRVHVKTHKTVEGTRMQVEAAGGVRATIVSTMVELWQIIESGLVEDGLVDDILYSMPIGEDKIEDIHLAQEKMGSKGVVRLMVDHPAQIAALGRFSDRVGRKAKWSVFVKVDGGGRRAGVPPTSQQMKDIISAILTSAHVEIHGFYSHFGQSYASDSLDKGSEYFAGEIDCVDAAARTARELGAEGNWILSVGATPTAHAATQQDTRGYGELQGELELHAGCYCMCDLQQHATGLVGEDSLALSVLARVVSTYPHRDGGGEALCDAGALAVSKDTGRYPGYGLVVNPPHARGWDLGRISQEHGTLTRRTRGNDEKDDTEEKELEVGEVVRIVPQHACLVCACFPWIYAVDDDGDTVVDVWVPWKGW